MKMIIDGKHVDAVGGKTIDNINPFSGELINKIPLSEKVDYEIAVQAARKAQPEWYLTPLQERMDILSRFVGLVRKNKDDIVNIMCAEGGKLIGEAKSEVDNFCTVFESCINGARRFFSSGTYADENDSAYGNAVFTERLPLGVFFIIVPSSFPVGFIAYKTAPAIAAGNAVILKPDIATSGSALYLTELMIQAGMPDGVVQCLTGSDAAAAEFLYETDDVDAICTIGEKSAFYNLKSISQFRRVFMDGVNNSAFIVLENAELDLAIEQAVKDRTYNAGQSDFAAKHFFVHKNVFEEVKQLLVERLGRIVMGDPVNPGVNLGPLVSAEAADKAGKYITMALNRGAKCILGGSVEGSFLSPTILTSVPENTEVYGPVFSITEFDSSEELVKKLNRDRVGPVCRIYAKNIGQAVRISTALSVESCVINGTASFASVQYPGDEDKYLELGVKDYRFPFLEYTKQKTIYINPELPIL